MSTLSPAEIRSVPGCGVQATRMAANRIESARRPIWNPLRKNGLVLTMVAPERHGKGKLSALTLTGSGSGEDC
jgi:hypothetical protein